MMIPEGYTEVCLDGLVEFTGDDYFFKRMMEMGPPATRERKKRNIMNPPMNGAQIAWERLGYEV